MDAEKMIKNIEEVLQEEGFAPKEEKSASELLENFILPGMKNSKDVLGSIYTFQVRERGGLFGKIKSKFQAKIVNTCINVIEKQSMKQQKFNELTYRAIEALIEENKELKSKIK